MHQIEAQWLDQESLDYLTRIDRSSGAEGTGVFVRRSARRLEPTLLPRFAVYAGLFAIGLVAAGFALRHFRGDRYPATRYLQTALLAAGGGLLVGGGLGLRQTRPRACLGDFYWADTQHLWDVSPEFVRYLPLDQVLHARGAIGGYTDAVFGMPVSDAPLYGQFAAITLDVSPGRAEHFTVYDLEAAGRLIHFINAALRMRQSWPRDSMAGAEPGRPERTTVRPDAGSAGDPPIVGGGGPLSRLRLPTPHRIESAGPPARPALWERLAPWLVVVLLGAVGVVVL